VNVRIASAAYVLPENEESAASILNAEKERVSEALAPLTPRARQLATENLGISRVRVCGARQPSDLALEAAREAIRLAGISPREVGLILDFSTFPGDGPHSISLAHWISAELGAETSLNLAFRGGGCGALHLAIKTALGWMAQDDRIRTALLVTGDGAPQGNRSLLPVTIQGDGASAMLLSRDAAEGPVLLGVEAMTLGHLHDAIALRQSSGGIEIVADAVAIEQRVMPIVYLHLYRLVNKLLAAHALGIENVDHFVYTNISRRDRDGFRRMLGLDEDVLLATRMAEIGHTFASDLIVNYVDLLGEKRILPGQLILFASSGVGFTWGASLARA
jgi:3-oxoacyl-[acyl-carrier-protein] synthase-3